jgi:hypothetical protein
MKELCVDQRCHWFCGYGHDNHLRFSSQIQRNYFRIIIHLHMIHGCMQAHRSYDALLMSLAREFSRNSLGVLLISPRGGSPRKRRCDVEKSCCQYALVVPGGGFPLAISIQKRLPQVLILDFRRYADNTPDVLIHRFAPHVPSLLLALREVLRNSITVLSTEPRLMKPWQLI